MSKQEQRRKERRLWAGRCREGSSQKNKEAATESRNSSTQPVTGHGNIQEIFCLFSLSVFICFLYVRSDVPVIPSSLFFDPHSAA
jgi:hypothetical protein